MFQRRRGSIIRLSPAPAKNTRMAIVNVSSPGTWIALIAGPRARAPARRWRGFSWLRLRGEQAEAEALRKEARRELPLDTVAGVVEARSECAEAPFAGRDGYDATADPALARQSDVIKPIPGGFVQARRRHDRQGEFAAFRVDHAL